MEAMTKPLTSLTAAELMTPNPVVISKHMSLRAAAHMLAQARISGAPVIDARGACVGVISSTDFVRRAEGNETPPELRARTNSCICSDWQMVELEMLPVEEVSEFMSKCTFTAAPETSLVELARVMVEAHIHRLIVVDVLSRPVGVVSTTDILAALANCDEEAMV